MYVCMYNGKKVGNPQSAHLLIGENNASKGEHLDPREYSLFTFGRAVKTPFHTELI